MVADPTTASPACSEMFACCTKRNGSGRWHGVGKLDEADQCQFVERRIASLDATEGTVDTSISYHRLIYNSR